MKTRSFASWPCTVARTVDILGDAWSVLILREAFYGLRRFDEFVVSLSIPRNTLTARLNALIEHGLVRKVQYQSEPVRHEYELTESGRDFFPVMVAMKTWGDKWTAHAEPLPIILRHNICGHELHATVVCDECGREVRLDDTTPHAGPGFPQRLLDNPAIAARLHHTAAQATDHPAAPDTP
ncbi:winged helix-turn-helix transcriptional regulator [Millisia brevis]|uniref:winged helix-turn-helix transcriptional regulator n=1 Tax=Millisia brevis TaxID=264148 RepID=UPI000832DD25|nr:helix-turn-helix domain-containing protein [Millisia brevis]